MRGRLQFAMPLCSAIEVVRETALRWARTERDGSIALIAAILLPVCVLVAGVGLDYATYLSERSKVQHAADAAALAGAKELSLSDANRQNVESVVDSMVTANLAASGGNSTSTPRTVTTRLINTSGTPMQVEVNVAGIVKSAFGGRLGLGDVSLAEDAASALRQVTADEFDVVVTDVRMAGVSG
ncbi:MAG: pilus assembly protein TadG-related protein, partial [Hyphomicrobium sp.]